MAHELITDEVNPNRSLLQKPAGLTLGSGGSGRSEIVSRAPCTPHGNEGLSWGLLYVDGTGDSLWLAMLTLPISPPVVRLWTALAGAEVGHSNCQRNFR